jgi:hypothetical protein
MSADNPKMVIFQLGLYSTWILSNLDYIELDRLLLLGAGAMFDWILFDNSKLI